MKQETKYLPEGKRKIVLTKKNIKKVYYSKQVTNNDMLKNEYYYICFFMGMNRD